MPRQKRTSFESCEFVGKGEEDIRDILKRQFIRYVNKEKGYPYLGLLPKNNHKIETKN